MPIPKISRGSFKPEDYGKIKAHLDVSRQTLVPVISKLSGCMHYWAGIDRATATMVNVSVWKPTPGAKQMETLAPMLELAGEFVKLGVVFERPIATMKPFGRSWRGASILKTISFSKGEQHESRSHRIG